MEIIFQPLETFLNVDIIIMVFNFTEKKVSLLIFAVKAFFQKIKKEEIIILLLTLNTVMKVRIY